MRSRCRGSMLAWILKMKPEKALWRSTVLMVGDGEFWGEEDG